MTLLFASRKRFYVLCCAVIALTTYLFITCAVHQTRSAPVSGDDIRAGDLIFMHGTSIRSAIVRFLEIGKADYSHVGLIVFNNGVPYVIHADPARGAVMKEPLTALLMPSRTSGATIYRVEGSPEAISQVCAQAQEYADEALPFDHEFDLETPRKLYCTELIWRAYLSAGLDLRGKWINSKRRYLIPCDLIQSGLLRQINYR